MWPQGNVKVENTLSYREMVVSAVISDVHSREYHTRLHGMSQGERTRVKYSDAKDWIKRGALGLPCPIVTENAFKVSETRRRACKATTQIKTGMPSAFTCRLFFPRKLSVTQKLDGILNCGLHASNSRGGKKLGNIDAACLYPVPVAQDKTS